MDNDVIQLDIEKESDAKIRYEWYIGIKKDDVDQQKLDATILEIIQLSDKRESDDFRDINAWLSQSHPDIYEKYIKYRPHIDARLSGNFYKNDNLFNIEELFVDPKFRRKGYSKMLMHELINVADTNCWNVKLNVSPFQENLRGLSNDEFVKQQRMLVEYYRDFGFKEYNKIEYDDSANVPIPMMRKNTCIL